ncbi:sensor histidine kinase [Caulobacter sp. RL271]|jgi:two-component system sensor histidine kinase TctE|uniref:histidine kinase n=1 Tax=Caulobacter segnis TaxID=88688 RepID=A0ABY4ZQZ6_9CAUL|nr:sensor histidine kinase [Caulobacter segnis]USQ95212.1 sensor histidine kinase [Caulobacter segnis]
MVRIRSLTTRLLVALVAPLIVSAVLIGIGDAWVTQRVVDDTSDRLLAGSVRAIAESVTFETDHIEVDLPPWAFGLLDSPQRDSVFYNVRESGRVLTGYDDLPDFDREAIAADGEPVFRTVVYQDRRVRQSAVALRVPGAAAPVVISVAQTLESRGAVRNSLMTTVGAIEVGLVGLVALLIWPAATWSLSPLDGLRRGLAKRSDARDPDFAPVAVGDVPNELQPVVVAFNSLLGQLERSVDGVRRFTADASHQIRTPLAIVKTHLAVLAKGKRTAADQDSLTDALEAVDRLQRLIEQLLALARAEAGETDGRQQADLAACARSLIDRWSRRATAEGATLGLLIEAEPVGVPLAAPLVDQILENLVDNALSYGGRTIVIGISQTEAQATLWVADDGPGLPPALQQRPFERFMRGPQSSGQGSGLGLSIVKALAERAGGDVVLEAPLEGGLRVGLSFPRISL